MQSGRRSTVAYDRADASREEVAALLDRVAHHVRAGIIVGDDAAIPLDDELDVRVVVTASEGDHEDILLRLALADR